MPKFTTEQAIDSINGRFKSKDGNPTLKLSSRSVKETLSALMPLAGEEMDLETFVDTIAYATIDTMNRNVIFETSEFAKNYKPTPTPPTPAPAVETEEERTAAINAAIEKAIAPLKAQLHEQQEGERIKLRDSEVEKLKNDNLKLSKAWDVDFNNATTIAKYELKNTATAQEVFDKAKEIFDKTLSARGEVYKPQEGTGEPGKSDFSDAIKRREAEVKRIAELQK